MDKVGIELQLKQNVEMQLKTMLPLLERMNKHTQELEKQLQQAKGVKAINQQLQIMTNHLKAVGQANRNLVSIVHQLNQVGNQAARASQKVGLLHRAFRGVLGAPMALAGMLGTFGSIYTVGNMFSKGMDFEQQVKSLQLAGLNPQQLKAAQETAKRTAADTRYITTPTEILESIRIGTAITRRPDEAIKMAPLSAMFNRAMRQIHAPGADEHNLSEFAYKMAEQLGVRDETRMKTLMDDLTKAEIAFAGQLDMQKLTQQLAMTRTAKYGADVLPLLIQLGHIITEVGTSGGGTAGARAGMQIQALSRILAQGTMTQAVATRFGQLGLIGGYDQALAAKQKSGHTVLIDTMTGERVLKSGSGSTTPPHLTKAEIGQLIVTGLVGRDLAIKDTPAWVDKYLVPAINKAEHVDLYSLARGGQDDRTKAVGVLTKWLAGTQLNAQDLLTQLILQRQIFTGQLTAAQQAPGMDKVMQQQMSMRNNLEQLQKAWDTFSITLTTNDQVVKMVNLTFKTLTGLLTDLSKSIGPMMDFIHEITNPGQTIHNLGSVAQPLSAIGSLAANNINQQIHHQATRLWHQGLAAGRSAGLVPAPGMLKMITQGAKFLIPAPPPMAHGAPVMMPQDFTQWPLQRQQQWMFSHPPDMTLPKVSNDAVHVTVNHTTMLDGKKIAEHTSHHVEKRQMKAAQRMSLATSGAGGSHTPSSYNAGGNQD
jgi:hypothetical protein